MADPSRTSSNRRILALAAGTLLNLSFGSLYAWSVFITALEMDLNILRADVSIVFSLAVVSFTAGNFVSPMLFGRVPIWTLPIVAAMSAVGGLGWAAMGTGYVPIVVGYGVLFGFGCGFAYNTSLQAAQRALPTKPGLANGVVISAFALGSVIAASILSDSIMDMGARSAFWLLGLTVGCCGVAATILLLVSGEGFPKQSYGAGKRAHRRILSICWVGFFLSALAGIMAIGHAATIITHFGGAVEAAVFGVTLLAIGNALGRLGAGWLSDIISVRSVAGISHLTGSIGFVVVLANPTGDGAIVAMTMAGLAYGIAASVYPSALSIFIGPDGHGRNVGILLTAWGAAGLIGPLLAGYFFDLTSDYRIPIEFACIASVLALINAMRLPRTNTIQA
jgi:OFA family oxalate/formate antiporter-like MFS transporter